MRKLLHNNTAHRPCFVANPIHHADINNMKSSLKGKRYIEKTCFVAECLITIYRHFRAWYGHPLNQNAISLYQSAIGRGLDCEIGRGKNR